MTKLANSVLSWQGLSVGFRGGDPILHIDDASFAEGECLVLLGPNGVGKSTFLRTVCGLHPPRAGRIEPTGQLSTRERAKLIAFVPQTEPTEFSWTVSEYVGLSRVMGGGITDTAKDRRAVAEALEKCDVARFADRPLGNLSGGELQRVRVARGLAQETPILALDEPTSHLDVAHACEVLNLIQTLCGSGKSVLVTIHDVNQALELPATYGLARADRLSFIRRKPESHELEDVFGVGFQNFAPNVFLPVTSRRTTG